MITVMFVDPRESPDPYTTELDHTRKAEVVDIGRHPTTVTTGETSLNAIIIIIKTLSKQGVIQDFEVEGGNEKSNQKCC